MTWGYIWSLLGPGLHWTRSREDLLAAIQRARSDRQEDAAQHIEFILELRDRVHLDTPEEKEAPPGWS